MVNNNLIRKAINFTIEKHKDQIRKISGLPYYVHPINVFSFVRKYKESKNITDLLCSALLHDILEDTIVSFEELTKEFNPRIASICLELKNDLEEIKRIGKFEYFCNKLRGISSYALTIKLADILDNISDEPSGKQKIGYIKAVEYISDNRKLSGTQLNIINRIKEYKGV
jgi:(p)ppGpp synthase/HD superfamily hydrolase